MKRLALAVCLVVLLTGCSPGKKDLDRAMALRSRLLAAAGCCFDAEVTADYGDKIYLFGLSCAGDSHGDVTFSVTEPETITGITGKISGEKGSFTFDDSVLYYPLLADDLLSPVSAPWVFLKTLRSGYITSAGMDGELLRLSIDDSYAEDALHLDIWLNEEDIPVRSEILWRGRKYLSLDVKNFRFE